ELDRQQHAERGQHDPQPWALEYALHRLLSTLTSTDQQTPVTLHVGTHKGWRLRRGAAGAHSRRRLEMALTASVTPLTRTSGGPDQRGRQAASRRTGRWTAQE